MDKLNMKTPNIANENFEKLAALFPNAVTETITGYDDNDKPIIEHVIDKDILMQEINAKVVDGKEERYQFTWPDKRKAILAANSPISETLRPCKEESVGKDGTPGGFDSENLYIEGDNLDVLKLLQETYLGKIKMIYIDPPYNTGNDFVYNDDFSENTDEYLAKSGQYDKDGNRLIQNTESNGRFHTDWLNMIFPRLKLARNILSDDGVIFISIDDNEIDNLKKICDEVFGEKNLVGQMTLLSNPRGSQNSKNLSYVHEYIVMYAKNINEIEISGISKTEESLSEFSEKDENGKLYRLLGLRKRGGAWRKEDRPNMFYPIYVNPINGSCSITKTNEYSIEVIPKRPTGELSRWTWGKEKFEAEKSKLFGKKVNRNSENDEWDIFRKDYKDNEDGSEKTTKLKTIWLEKETNYQNAKNEIKALFGNSELFDFPKPTYLVKRLASIVANDDGDIVLDFFSGSATTAQAIIDLNLEDSTKRKFILVQLPEETDEKSEAFKAGYKNICEIGKERIRRAGKKVRDENPLTTQDLDTGFRVLKLDSTNMKDVYYNPEEIAQNTLDGLVDNIKGDRTNEDLLFQTMLELGVPLSSTIKEEKIGGVTVFNVGEENFLIATFDSGVTDDVVKQIAQKKPYYFVVRDSSMDSDAVAANFEQIFKTYSPDTKRKVL